MRLSGYPDANVYKHKHQAMERVPCLTRPRRKRGLIGWCGLENIRWHTELVLLHVMSHMAHIVFRKPE